jgi:uncharacterized protein YkwD
LTRHAIDTEVAAVPTHILNRILPVAAITAGLLLGAPAAQAADGKKKKTVTATIALGDKRPATIKAKARKAKPKASASAAKPKKPKAKTSQLAPCSNTDVMPTPETVEVVREAILCLHNQIRSQKGLPLLKDNAKLRKAAIGHSSAMVNQGYFDHTSPDGGTFVDRILDARYAKSNDAWSLGENLAWGTGELSTATGIMDSWMASSGHKANILKKAYREVGIGIRIGVPSDEGVGATVTADFGVKL